LEFVENSAKYVPAICQKSECNQAFFFEIKNFGFQSFVNFSKGLANVL
jgi:hypothetical protein